MKIFYLRLKGLQRKKIYFSNSFKIKKILNLQQILDHKVLQDHFQEKEEE